MDYRQCWPGQENVSYDCSLTDMSVTDQGEDYASADVRMGIFSQI